MSKIQRVILIVLGSISIVTAWVVSTASLGSSPEGAASEAIASFNLQTAGDSTVYQQQVSALWANKDLLKVLADTNQAQLNVQVATNWLLAALVSTLITIALVYFKSPAKAEAVKADQPATEI